MISRLFSLLVLGGLLAACGSLAEPRPTFAPTNTALPRGSTVSHDAMTSAQDNPAGQQAALEPTSLPPTATPQPTATPTPTEAPTEAMEHAAHSESTAKPTASDAPPTDVVMVNGIEGDPISGEFWFNGGVKVTFNNTEWQCSTCHNVNAPEPGTGPYLYGIANHAAEHGAAAGLDAVEYLADSILNPGHIIAPAQVHPDGTEYTWKDGVMPNNWGTVLDETMLADLVAFLMQQNQAGEDHSQHSN